MRCTLLRGLLVCLSAAGCWCSTTVTWVAATAANECPWAYFICTDCQKMQLNNADAFDEIGRKIYRCESYTLSGFSGTSLQCRSVCDRLRPGVIWMADDSYFNVDVLYSTSCSTSSVSCSSCYWDSNNCGLNQYWNCADVLDNAPSCTNCPIGSTRDLTIWPTYAPGLFVCKCTAGYHSSANPASSTLQSSINRVASSINPPSSYYSSYGIAPCSACAAGKFTPGDYYTTCSNCPANTYQPSTGQSACLSCPGISCLAGQYVTSCSGSSGGTCSSCTTVDLACPDGKYRLGCAGMSTGSCENCPTWWCGKGQYLDGCSGLSTGSCANCLTDCEDGEYRTGCSGRSSGECTACVDNCPDGLFLVGCGGLSAGLCLSCGANSDYDTDLQQCRCRPGSFAQSYSADGILPFCMACPSGKYTTLTGATECTPCVSGEYQDETGQTYCKSCTGVISCEPGQYISLTCGGSSSGSCSPCPTCPSNSNRVGCQGGSDGECEPCSMCPANQYMQVLCGSGQAKVCGACDYTQCTQGNELRHCEERSPGVCRYKALKFFTETDPGKCTDWVFCPAGSFRSSCSNSACSQCPAGTYTPAGNRYTSCFPCPRGMRQPNVGMISCTACGAGSYQPTQGSSSCLTCSGSVSNSYSSTICCPGYEWTWTAGSNPVTGTCTQCPSGKYSSTVNEICLDCPANSYSATGSSACTSCTADQVVVGLSCVATCVKGFTYNAYSVSGTCTVGSFCTSSNYVDLTAYGTTPLSCAAMSTEQSAVFSAGLYKVSSNRVFRWVEEGSCMKAFTPFCKDLSLQSQTLQQNLNGVMLYACQCRPGYYAAYEPGSSVVPSACLQSEVSDSMYYCKPCPTGSFSLVGDFACRTCPQGQRFDDSSQSCVTCPSGMFSRYNSQYDYYWCDDCPSGTFASSVTQTFCSDCPAGSHLTLPGVCQQCPSGTYQNVSRQSFCYPCPSGTTSSAGSVCCEGYYLKDNLCVTCPLCAPDYYRNGCSGTSSGACVACPSNTCPIGLYTTGMYLSGCRGSSIGECLPCELCPSGTYRSGCTYTSPGTCESCDWCPPGQYAYDCGNVWPGRLQGSCLLCRSCPSGQYAAGCRGNQNGICAPCTSCALFETRVGCGGASPGTCEPCAECPTGQFKRDCQSACEPCVECEAQEYRVGCGRFGPGTCQSCTLCPPGTYNQGCSIDSPGVCTVCATCSGTAIRIGCGGFSEGICISLGSFPSHCPGGMHYKEGILLCEDCPPTSHTITDIDGSKRCSAVPEIDIVPPWNGSCVYICNSGTYSPGKSDRCIPCSDGYSSLTGSASCAADLSGFCLSPCPADTFSTGLASSCIPCPYATFSPPGSTFCKTCTPGKRKQFGDAGGCPDCGPGTYSDTYEAERCTQCPPGTYNDEAGMSFCYDCALLRRSRMNTSLPQGCACEPGFYEVNGECVPCVDGFYCEVLKQ
jgi:hypothetical protein